MGEPSPAGRFITVHAAGAVVLCTWCWCLVPRAWKHRHAQKCLQRDAAEPPAEPVITGS